MNKKQKTKMIPPAEGTNRRAEITILSRVGGQLNKTLWLDENGKLKKTPVANMSRGSAERMPVGGASDLAEVIRQLKPFQAPVLGRLRLDLPDKVKVTTQGQLEGAAAGVIARDQAHLIYKEGCAAVVLLDYDDHDMPDKIVVKEFWKTLLKICPALRSAERVVRPSTSNGLYRLDNNEPVPGSSGMHVYVFAKDGSDIVRFLTALFERCWLAGYGWIMISENGRMLERSIVDKTVAASERLIFEAAPTLKWPLAQRPEGREPIVVEGEFIDTRTACPSLTDEERETFNKLVAEAKAAIEPEALQVKAVYDETRIEEQVSQGMRREQARAQVDAMWRGVLMSDTVLLFKDPKLKGCTVKDVLDDPKRFEGKYCADPAEISLGRDKARVKLRLRDGWPYIKVYAHGVTGTTYSLQYTEAAKAEMDPLELPRIEEAEALTAEIMEEREKAGVCRMCTDDWLKKHPFVILEEPPFNGIIIEKGLSLWATTTTRARCR
jgi:hypothetical protein